MKVIGKWLDATLSSLKNVVFTSPQVGDVLTFNGTYWVNQTGVDNCSGYSVISDGATGSVPSGRQMINFTQLTLNGDLTLDGDLWLV